MSGRRRWLLGCATLLVGPPLAIALAVASNNHSLRRMSRAEFTPRLDRSIEAATQWISEHPEVYGNPPIMFMVMDMERLTGDARLRRMLDAFRVSRFVTDPKQRFGPVWVRMIDSTAPVPMMDFTAVPAYDIMEILWDAHAIAPDRILISEAQRANMFSRTRFSWGRRQHQLLAVAMYRYYNGPSPETDSSANHLAEKVARDAHYDIRVNDSYPQRSAFVLAAGPDLIRPRWIERLIDYQQPDGRWRYCWYRWCKGVFEFSARDIDPAHTTVQAAWALIMLKHRYPRWIEQHYR